MAAPAGERLLEAARAGDARTAKALLAAGTPPDAARTLDGQTALWLAANRGHAEAARLLVEAGADPVAGDCIGDTPLVRAAVGGHHDIISSMAAARPEVFVTEGAALALRRAALSAKPLALRALLKGGTPVDARAGGWPTALFAAVAACDSACVAELLAAGASPRQVNKQGQTPLHLAAATNSITIIGQLLAAGSDLSVRDRYGRLAMDLAVTEFVRRLLLPSPPVQRRHPVGAPSALAPPRPHATESTTLDGTKHDGVDDA